MKALRGAALGWTALLVSACAVPASRPVPSETAARVSASFAAAREAAWAPRRFKALFRGEISPRAGAVVRGFLAVWWDGTSLVWKTSAPLVGAARDGALRRGGSGAAGLLPGRLEADDALSALLGAPSRGALFELARAEGDLVRVPLEGGDRSVLLDSAGQVVGLAFPDGAGARLEPGAGVPRRIEVRGPGGGASLSLESYGPWPEGEPIPGPGAPR
jgi:hypothetical protein